MNLVAKEFVACQIDDPGVLIISPFAGAGEMMHEALIVNPYEMDQTAEMMHRALTMPLDERQVRIRHLQQRERFVGAAERVGFGDSSHGFVEFTGPTMWTLGPDPS